MALPNGTFAIKDNSPLRGNPTLDSLDGERRAPLEAILSDSWTDAERAAFGVYLVDVTAPEGQRWTGTFAGSPPAAVFEAIVITSAHVNQERDRRLNGTFEFAGKDYDCDEQSLARLTGAATLAGFAMGAGAPAGYLRWHGGDEDFAWIAHDNSLVAMDAQTCFALGQAAARNQSSHIFAAKAIKEMDPIPADFTDDAYWATSED